jgi:hypothetical protein
VACGVGVDVQGLVRVVGAVEQQPRAQAEHLLVAASRSPTVGTARSRWSCWGPAPPARSPPAARPPAATPAPYGRRPAAPASPRPAGPARRPRAARRPAGTPAQQLAVELGERAGVDGVEDDLAQPRSGHRDSAA